MRWIEGMACCLATGVTLFVVGVFFHFLVPLVAPGIPMQFRNNPALFRPWAGWTSTYMILHPFGYGIIFALIYLASRTWCGFPAGWRGGLLYGAGVFVVGGLPVYLLVFASFQMSVEVILFWVMQSACQYLTAGFVVSLVAN